MARNCRDQRPVGCQPPARCPLLQAVVVEAEVAAWKPPEAHIADTSRVASRKCSGTAPQRRCCGAQFWYREIERDYGSREDWGKLFPG